MLVEHVLEPLNRNGGEFAASQLGQAIQVQQLALREQHHQGADLIVEQYRLNA